MAGRTGRVRSTAGKSSVHSEGNVQDNVDDTIFISLRRTSMWPFFSARRFPRYTKRTNEFYDVPADLWAKWVKAMHDFHEVQREMRHYYEKNH